MNSLNEKIQKIKLFLIEPDRREKILTVAVIFLVGTASFGLGRLSALDTPKEPVKIEMNQNFVSEASQAVSLGLDSEKEEEIVSETDTDLKEGGFVVASKNGGKYHFPWCSGAKRILEENKVYFESIEEARGAGYEPAGNCKGLE